MMADVPLARLYGLPDHVDDAQPEEMLLDLGYGPFVTGLCRPRPRTRSRCWLRVSALPVRDPLLTPPLERLLVPLSGAETRLELLLYRSETTGIQLFVGFGDDSARRRARSLLAPSCDLASAAPPNHHDWTAVGLTHRLQGELRNSDDSPAEAAAALDQLAGIDGDWLVHWQIGGVRVQGIDEFAETLLRLADDAAARISVSRMMTSVETATVTSPMWSRVQSWVEILYSHTLRGRADGLWAVHTWLAGSDGDAVHDVVGALRSVIPADGGRTFATSSLTCTDDEPAAPLSLLTSRDIGAIFEAPGAGIPGIAVRPPPPPGRRPSTDSRKIVLGRYWGQAAAASVGVGDFEGHAFVTGTTGSGKTTSLHRLLSEAWNQHRIPFLVIDPIKDEYSHAAGLFDGGITVVTGQELRLNLLEPWPGADGRAHMARVAQAFRGAFSMPSPTPYVVTHLFDSASVQPGGPAGTDLHDLRDALGPLVDSLGYAAEARTNILASLMTRLNVLLSPVRAHRFSWTDSSMLQALFDAPTVITLADIPDDEERAFIVLVLALAAWDRARCEPSEDPVGHILVLEEAHRVIPNIPDSSPDDEQGSASRVSAELLSAMLAEVRGFGQQVVVVDQSPGKVSSDVLRNTNLKIVHRIVHPDDQADVAAALGLDPESSGLLGTLARGQVIVSTRLEPSPQTLLVEPATAFGGHSVLPPSGKAASWPCCLPETVPQAEGHHRAWAAATDAAPHMALLLVGLRTGSGDGNELRQHVLRRLLASRPSTDTSTECLAWVGLRRVLARERANGNIASRQAFEEMLRCAYEAWAQKMSASAGAVSLPSLEASYKCQVCEPGCEVRAPAGFLNEAAPRVGPLALVGRGWRESFADVGRWARSEVERLQPLLDAGPAFGLVRCQLAQAAQTGGLTDDALKDLLSRSAPTPSS